MKNVAWLAVVGCLSVAACKEAPPEPGDPQALQSTPVRLGINDVGAAFAAASCAQRQRCCDGHERVSRWGEAAGGDIDSCVKALSKRFESYGSRVANSHLRGRVGYDGEKLKGCLASLSQQSCTAARQRASAGPDAGSDCATWLSPRVGLGGSCSDDNECMSGYCQGRAAAKHGQMSEGMCAPLPAVGQSCTDSCMQGAFCDAHTDAPRCVVTQPQGASCREDEECQSGLCHTSPGSTFGTCDVVAPDCSSAL